MEGFKMIAFEARPDETAEFQALSRELGIEVALCEQVPTKDNAGLTEGCAGVSVLGQGTIDGALLDLWAARGVRYISTRTIGYDHIDLRHAEALGLRVCGARYAPNGVAEFTVMLMLMCIRNCKQAMWRSKVNDFSLAGLEGRELKDLTVGVVGTGQIGEKVIEILSGFGCRILAYNHSEKERVRRYAAYVDLDTLFRESDIITLHLPTTPETYHIVDAGAIEKMRDQVVLINCSRGELMDIHALVEGVESEKIGAIGMDTIEGENGIAHRDRRSDIVANRDLFYLQQFRNVILTQHMAFYTDAAVRSMVRCGVEGIVKMARGEPCATELTGRG